MNKRYFFDPGSALRSPWLERVKPEAKASLVVKRLQRLLLMLAAALPLFAFPVHAEALRDDPLVVASERDERQASETAKRLFDYAERYFDRYRMTTPQKDDVSVEVLADGSESRRHDAVFDSFRASFWVGPDGKRILDSMSTRSRAFVLPSRLKMGDSMARVRQVLGAPSAISSDLFLFQIRGEALSDVFFRFENGRLAEVSWLYGAAD